MKLSEWVVQERINGGPWRTLLRVRENVSAETNAYFVSEQLNSDPIAGYEYRAVRRP